MDEEPIGKHDIPDPKDTERFPSNSLKSRKNRSAPLRPDDQPILNADIVPANKVERATVVEGRIKKKKPSAMKRFSNSMLGDDARTVTQHILYEVLIPALKETITDMVSTGIEMLMFGERQTSRRTGRRGRGSYVNYGSFSRSYRDREEEEGIHDLRRRGSRSRYDFSDIYFEDGNDAREVLSSMADILEEYRVVTVGAFYDLSGIKDKSWADEKWGWTDLSDAYVSRTRNGFHIFVRPPKELD